MSTIIVFFLGCFIKFATGDCPFQLPIPHKGYCYGLQNTLMSKRAESDGYCDKAVKGSVTADLPDFDMIENMAKIAEDFIEKKTLAAAFWIGLREEPPPPPPEKKKGKKWIFDADDSRVEEKDFKLWIKKPSTGETCSMIRGVLDYGVMPVDCGGMRLAVICLKKEAPCNHDTKPYMQYEDMCIAVITAPLEYKYYHATCKDDGDPVPFKDKEMQKKVVLAASNSFLGGGSFVDLAKDGDGKWVFKDGREVPAEWWQENEPNNAFDCAVLSMNLKGKFRLRTMNCDFEATAVCRIKAEDGEE